MIQIHWWKIIIELTHYFCKMALKCQKIARKFEKKTFEVELPPTKMLLSLS